MVRMVRTYNLVCLTSHTWQEQGSGCFLVFSWDASISTLSQYILWTLMLICCPTGRQHIYREKRFLSEQTLSATGMQLHDFNRIGGHTLTFPTMACYFVPVTTVPTGDQSETCSCIDHVPSDGCLSEATLHCHVFLPTTQQQPQRFLWAGSFSSLPEKSMVLH